MKNEITLKAFFLSIFLSIILSSAMVYLGLYAGMTISASIPAAIMSMGILRLFKNSNILENNIVQTAASAGESLAAGVIFTLPALLLIGYWDTISYWEVTKIAMVGGILGALFTVPLRRALILKAQLRFPEGNWKISMGTTICGNPRPWGNRRHGIFWDTRTVPPD